MTNSLVRAFNFPATLRQDKTLMTREFAGFSQDSQTLGVYVYTKVGILKSVYLTLMV